MPTFTKTANDVINAVIQDGMVMTTNRTALLDYTNRVSLRILRESQWAFLQSDYKKFVTRPGVERYWIGFGPPPDNCVDTGLSLSDAESILPESVYNLSDSRPLTQVASNVRFSVPYLHKDSNVQTGSPLGYAAYVTEPNVIQIFPPPNSSSPFIPKPETPYCTSLYGGVRPGRRLFVKSTFVDSLGGESLPSEATEIVVPSNFSLIVASPKMEVSSSTSVDYSAWNTYVSSTVDGQFLKQNAYPLPIGILWKEGLSTLDGSPIIPTSLLMGAVELSVSTAGQLTTQELYVPTNSALRASDGHGTFWYLTTNVAGNLVLGPSFQRSVFIPTLLDSNNQAWQILIDPSGELATTSLGAPPVFAPTPVPATSTIEPLLGYVIGFRYQKKKSAITSPDSVLQIPDAYFDVVVAGVNAYASMYMSKSDDENFKAPMWKREFNDGLAQIRRDLRINYRNTDVILPDRSIQYRNIW